MDNPEKRTTKGTQTEGKKNQYTTEYVLETTSCKQNVNKTQPPLPPLQPTGGNVTDIAPQTQNVKKTNRKKTQKTQKHKNLNNVQYGPSKKNRRELRCPQRLCSSPN